MLCHVRALISVVYSNQDIAVNIKQDQEETRDKRELTPFLATKGGGGIWAHPKISRISVHSRVSLNENPILPFKSYGCVLK